MNKQVKAEILKVVRSNQLIIWISIIVLFCLLMFIQKGINVNSGFYTPELITAQYMSSFNLLIFALLGFIPGAFIGAYLAGIEYSSNTNSSLILSSGRSRTIFHKIIGLLIIIFIMTISISMLGFLEGLAFNYKSIYSLNFSSIVKQMISSFLIVSRVSVIAFLGATLTKRFYGGIIIAIVLPTLLNFMNISLLKLIRLENLDITLISYSFKNVSNDPQISYINVYSFGYIPSILLIVMIIFVLFIMNISIIKRRNFEV